MAKTLCEWSRKDIASKPLKLARLIDQPRFYCAKCARGANQAKSLCKARKLPINRDADSGTQAWASPAVSFRA